VPFVHHLPVYYHFRAFLLMNADFFFCPRPAPYFTLHALVVFLFVDFFPHTHNKK
jgi:hypothetical protein